jgi:GTP-binding protein
MALAKVAIVGRPNVGKSSIFNWLAERRISIVDDMAGVTRDRVTTLIEVEGKKSHADDVSNDWFFELIDTGGIGMVDRDDLENDVYKQIDVGFEEADVLMFVVDLKDGIMPLDEHVAGRLRTLGKPVILVTNKADNQGEADRAGEFLRLGLGEPVVVGVLHNRNRSGLLEAIHEAIPPALPEEKPGEAAMKIAVVGRPNSGKSTFINTLLQTERMIVSEIPGTTRDSVDVRFQLDNMEFMAIDTAGIKRKAKVRDSLDFYSIHRAERSIRRADVVLLFLDSMQEVTRLDKQIADTILQESKPCILVANKWDIMPAEARTEYMEYLQNQFRAMSFVPFAVITGKSGRNVKALIHLARKLYKQAHHRVSTGKLNRMFREIFDTHPPAMRSNRNAKLFFASQVAVAPPTIALVVNDPKLFDPNYIRYVLNAIRERGLFYDIPLKIVLRKRTPGDPTRKAQVEEDVTEDSVYADDESKASADWSEIVVSNRSARPRNDEDESAFISRWLSREQFGPDDEAFEDD